MMQHPDGLFIALRSDVARGSFCQPAQLTQTRTHCTGCLRPIATTSQWGWPRTNVLERTRPTTSRNRRRGQPRSVVPDLGWWNRSAGCPNTRWMQHPVTGRLIDIATWGGITPAVPAPTQPNQRTGCSMTALIGKYFIGVHDGVMRSGCVEAAIDATHYLVRFDDLIGFSDGSKMPPSLALVPISHMISEGDDNHSPPAWAFFDDREQAGCYDQWLSEPPTDRRARLVHLSKSE
jgi:hypothetical protein